MITTVLAIAPAALKCQAIDCRQACYEHSLTTDKANIVCVRSQSELCRQTDPEAIISLQQQVQCRSPVQHSFSITVAGAQAGAFEMATEMLWRVVASQAESKRCAPPSLSLRGVQYTCKCCWLQYSLCVVIHTLPTTGQLVAASAMLFQDNRCCVVGCTWPPHPWKQR